MERLSKNLLFLQHHKRTSKEVATEIESGLMLLNGVDRKIITFFGAHQEKTNGKMYKHCKDVAYRLGKRGYAIASGGGPGIMNAANSGAMQAKVPSIGIKAGLIKGEPSSNKVFTHLISFKFLFVRRFILSLKSEALIFYPGGYGTLDELFEYAVLMQVDFTDHVPIILVNKKYWSGLYKWLDDQCVKPGYMDKKKLEYFHIVDDVKEIIDIIEGKRS